MARDVSKADVASDVSTKQQLLKLAADAFSASVIGNLSSSEIRLIDASSFNDLSTEQVGALTAGQISSLSVAQFSALPASSIGELGKFYDVLNAITADQWRALTPTQYANIGNEAQKNSATDQLYSAKGVPAFDKNFDLSGLTPAQLPSIPVVARSGLRFVKIIDADTEAALLSMPKPQSGLRFVKIIDADTEAALLSMPKMQDESIEVHGIRPDAIKPIIQPIDADTAAALLQDESIEVHGIRPDAIKPIIQPLDEDTAAALLQDESIKPHRISPEQSDHLMRTQPPPCCRMNR